MCERDERVCVFAHVKKRVYCASLVVVGANQFTCSLKLAENLASPLQILIDASNGASDYGNKFGEPLIAGYCRTYGQRLANGERREWIKPIMFSGGVGQIDHRYVQRGTGEEGKTDRACRRAGTPACTPHDMLPPLSSHPPSFSLPPTCHLLCRHLEKDDGEISMLVVKIGGPAYRIGMGGGAASSLASG